MKTYDDDLCVFGTYPDGCVDISSLEAGDVLTHITRRDADYLLDLLQRCRIERERDTRNALLHQLIDATRDEGGCRLWSVEDFKAMLEY